MDKISLLFLGAWSNNVSFPKFIWDSGYWLLQTTPAMRHLFYWIPNGSMSPVSEEAAGKLVFCCNFCLHNAIKNGLSSSLCQCSLEFLQTGAGLLWGELCIVHSTLKWLPVPLDETHACIMMLPPPCFTLRMVFSRWGTVLKKRNWITCLWNFQHCLVICLVFFL